LGLEGQGVEEAFFEGGSDEILEGKLAAVESVPGESRDGARVDGGKGLEAVAPRVVEDEAAPGVGLSDQLLEQKRGDGGHIDGEGEYEVGVAGEKRGERAAAGFGIGYDFGVEGGEDGLGKVLVVTGGEAEVRGIEGVEFLQLNKPERGLVGAPGEEGFVLAHSL
jgi:hypothetical protein